MDIYKPGDLVKSKYYFKEAPTVHGVASKETTSEDEYEASFILVDVGTEDIGLIVAGPTYYEECQHYRVLFNSKVVCFADVNLKRYIPDKKRAVNE